MFLHRICNKAEQCNMADCPVLNYKFQRARHTDRNVVTYMTFVIIKLRLIDPPEVQVKVTGHRAIALFFSTDSSIFAHLPSESSSRPQLSFVTTTLCCEFAVTLRML